MLKISETLSRRLGAENMRVVVVAETDNFQKAFSAFDGMEVQKMAIAYAATQGIAAPAINSVRSHPFPLNRDHEDINELLNSGVPDSGDRVQPHRYAVAIQVASRI